MKHSSESYSSLFDTLAVIQRKYWCDLTLKERQAIIRARHILEAINVGYLQTVEEDI